MAINITVDGQTYEDVEVISVGGKVLTLIHVEDSSGGGSGDSGGNTGGNTGGDTNLTWEDGVPYTLSIVENEYPDKLNGEIKSESGWNRTDYTYCYGAGTIKVVGGARASSYNAFYDINKNFISAFDTHANYTTTIDVPENAVYFIVSNTESSMANTSVTPHA